MTSRPVKYTIVLQKTMIYISGWASLCHCNKPWHLITFNRRQIYFLNLSHIMLLSVFSANSDQRTTLLSLCGSAASEFLIFRWLTGETGCGGIFEGTVHHFYTTSAKSHAKQTGGAHEYISAHGSFSYKCQATLWYYLYYVTLSSKQKWASDTTYLVLKGHQSLPPTCHKSSV